MAATKSKRQFARLNNVRLPVLRQKTSIYNTIQSLIKTVGTSLATVTLPEGQKKMRRIVMDTVKDQLDRPIEVNPYLIFKNTTSKLVDTADQVLEYLNLSERLNLASLIKNISFGENLIKNKDEKKKV